MVITNEIRAGRHCVSNLHVHLVFVTKYRRHVFTKKILGRMQEIFAEVCHDFEATLTEFDGEDDHVHLLVMYPPKVSISKLVNSLKGISSRLLRKDFPELIDIGVAFSGPPAISLPLVVVRPSRLSNSIFCSKRLLTDRWRARASYPRPEGQDFTALLIRIRFD